MAEPRIVTLQDYLSLIAAVENLHRLVGDLAAHVGRTDPSPALHAISQRIRMATAEVARLDDEIGGRSG